MTQTARAEAEAPARFDRTLVTPMILGSILNPINSSMLAVALIPIGKAFGAPPAQTAWLVTGLYLATAVGQPVIGRLVDSYGPRLLYLTGTSLVGVAGLLGTLAPNLWLLVLSRVLLGFGTSAAYPASMFLLRHESERTGMSSPRGILAGLTISAQVIAVVGPTLGGALIALGGWHLIFAINVPLSVACLILGGRYLPKLADLPRQHVDVVGMVLFAAALTAFMLFLMKPGLPQSYLLVLAALGATAFARWELRGTEPFIDLHVLRGNTPLLLTYVRQLLAYTTSYSFLYGYTQWLEDGRGLTASVAGMLLLPMSAAAVVATVLTGRRAGIRSKLLTGASFQIVSCALLLLVGTASPVWALAMIGVVMGVPQGLNGLANQNALYEQAEPARMGSSAGLLRTFMYLGALLAAAANAAVYQGGADTGGLHHLGMLLLVVSALLLLVTLVDRKVK